MLNISLLKNPIRAKYFEFETYLSNKNHFSVLAIFSQINKSLPQYLYDRPITFI